MYVRIGIVARYWGVSTSTIRAWEREGKIACTFRTKGGHRRYDLNEIRRKTHQQEERKEHKPIVVGYARVSATKQKEDLKRQKEELVQYAQKNDLHLLKIFSDIGSGMNEERKGLQRMLGTIATQNIEGILCTYTDRIARFGTILISHYCKTFGTVIIPLHTPLGQTVEGQLVDDLLALVTSFAGKLHRQRRKNNSPNTDVLTLYRQMSLDTLDNRC